MRLHTPLGQKHRAAEHCAELESNGWTALSIPELAAAHRDLEVAGRRFFSLDNAAKSKFDIRDSIGHRGWVPVDECGDYCDEGARRYEAFDIGAPATGHHRHVLDGPNHFPGDDFQHAVATAWSVLDKVTSSLLEAACAHLDVPIDMLQQHRSQPVSQLRLINYLPSSEPGSDKAAMGAHTDYELLTVLYQSSPGIELLDLHEGWVTPDLEPGSVLVLVGDALEVFSGGRFTSTMHRVAPGVASGRMSIPFFAAPDFNAVIEPVTGRNVDPLAFGEHLVQQLRRDFPYFDDLCHNRDLLNATSDDFVIDLTADDRRLSRFEKERMRHAART